jgi:hypothetical protein
VSVKLLPTRREASVLRKQRPQLRDKLRLTQLQLRKKLLKKLKRPRLSPMSLMRTESAQLALNARARDSKRVNLMRR